MTQVYIGLGSNLDNREKTLTDAAAFLAPKVNVLRASRVYETAPWGYVDQPAFLNQVIEAVTGLDPPALLRHLKGIETQLGREPTFRFGPRLIDLDILLFGLEVINLPELQVPHPAMAERAFVLAPLAELAPNLVHPMLNKSISELVRLVDREGVKLFVKNAKWELDLDLCPVEVPADFEAALKRNPISLELFNKMPPSHKKEYIDWLESAIQPATRQRRIEKAIQRIVEKKTSK